MSLEKLAEYYYGRYTVYMSFQSKEEFLEEVRKTYERIYGEACPVL